MTGRYERFWNQYDEVRLRQGDRFTVWPPTAQRHNDEAPKFVYETGKVLCHTEAAEMVRDRMGISAETSAPLPGELTGITLPGTTDIYEWVRAANAGCAPGQPCVTPNYLVSITPVNMCPANEPLPVGPDAQPWPPRAAQPAAGGREVTIQVVDTGIFLDALNDPYQQRHPWLAGIVRPPEVSLPDFVRNPFERPGEGLPILATGGTAAGDLMDTDTVFKNSVYDERTRRIKEYAGHGTFIAGVIGCAAPNARIRMHNALQDGGALLETDLGTKLLEVVHTYGWPDIISLSAGCPTMDGAELKGLKLFMAELAKQETLLIAAAGNDGERDAPFYPAAYAQSYPGVVVSVGALRREEPLGRACFTNYGRSVTVYARGERHVNAFPVGQYAYHHPTEEHCHNYPLPKYPDGLYPRCTCLDKHDGPASFDGMAEWSGTSFATPLVAAKVAVYLRENPDISPRQAFDEIFNKQTQSIPDASDADGEPLRAFL